MENEEKLKLVTFDGDFTIDSKLLQYQLEEINSHFAAYSKRTESENEGLEIYFEEGSFAIGVLVGAATIGAPVASYLIKKRFADEYVNSKKLEKQLIRDEIKSFELKNNDYDEIVEIVFEKSDEKIIVSKKTYEYLKNEKVAKLKKKIAKEIIKNRRTARYSYENDSANFDDETLRNIENNILISEKLNSKTLVKKGTDANAELKFVGVKNTNPKTKYFIGGKYKEVKIEEPIDFNGCLEDIDLDNDFEPTPYVSGPVIKCSIEYEHHSNDKTAFYKIKILEIKKILRKEKSSKQLRVDDLN